MKVLITGITGRVGANVAQKFLQNGHAVRGFVWPGDRQAEKMQAIGAEMVEGDLASSSDVKAAAEDQEIILHLGAAFQAG
ncbi:MAG: nucleoside-diphosphate-sugar epimerase, partial [Candidatus Latescibacterota bacterium]